MRCSRYTDRWNSSSRGVLARDPVGSGKVRIIYHSGHLRRSWSSDSSASNRLIWSSSHRVHTYSYYIILSWSYRVALKSLSTLSSPRTVVIRGREDADSYLVSNLIEFKYPWGYRKLCSWSDSLYDPAVPRRYVERLSPSISLYILQKRCSLQVGTRVRREIKVSR